MSGISTHVLDLVAGRPAAGLVVELRSGAESEALAQGRTDEDGRIRELLPGSTLRQGIYRLRFETGAYFEEQGIAAFHPWVEIAIAVRNPAEHYHVPLLVTPHSYSTYRGT